VKSRKVFWRTIRNTNETQAPFYNSARQANRIRKVDLVLLKKLDDSLVRVVFGRSEYQRSFRAAIDFLLRACYKVYCPGILSKVQVHNEAETEWAAGTPACQWHWFISFALKWKVRHIIY